MAEILLLDENTINKIAAGEVVERPSAVVKELVENAIDAGATAITIEIKNGGTQLIRITDNGSGIEKKQVRIAFARHATSKIRSAEDLLAVTSLGFRGEALASVSAVAQVELITKTRGELTGTRYEIDGGTEKNMEEIGCPEGTTFVVRNLFYNVPARRKFLKSAQTETSYVNDLVERLAISNPNVSFRFMSNNQLKLQTSGNGNVKDIIYHIYGRDITAQLLPVNTETPAVSITGFVAKPVVNRGNRNYMNYFINGRYIRNNVINKAIEEAYKPYMMQHRYPMTALQFQIDSQFIDVNVHPAKMEVRFTNGQAVYQAIYTAITDSICGKNMIPEVTIGKEKKPPKQEKKKGGPEPFEIQRKMEENKNVGRQKAEAAKIISQYETIKNTIGHLKEDTAKDLFAEKAKLAFAGKEADNPEGKKAEVMLQNPKSSSEQESEQKACMDLNMTVEAEKQPDRADERAPQPVWDKTNTKQEVLFGDEGEGLLSQKQVKHHKIIGQIFDTYWIVQYEDKMFLIDQHAAHEKVLFEKTMRSLEKKEITSQLLQPPIILSLTMQEEHALQKHKKELEQMGFEIESFGGREFSVRAVPANLFGVGQVDLLTELLDSLTDEIDLKYANTILEKVASMSCKAAIKGNMKLSVAEAEALIDQLMELENPYHCPHGRPVIVSMSKYEIEKKFKRIV